MEEDSKEIDNVKEILQELIKETNNIVNFEIVKRNELVLKIHNRQVTINARKNGNMLHLSVALSDNHQNILIKTGVSDSEFDNYCKSAINTIIKNFIN